MNRDHVRQAFEHALAAALLLFAPTLWLGESLWQVKYFVVLIVVVSASVYLVCAAYLTYARSMKGRVSLLQVLICVIAAHGVAFIVLKCVEWQWPDKFGLIPGVLLFSSSALGVALLVGLFSISGLRTARLVLLSAALLASIAVHVYWSRNTATLPAREVSYLDTALYIVKTTTYRNTINDNKSRGGGIAAFNGGYLLSGGDGELYTVTESHDGMSLDIHKLQYRVPFNQLEFDRDALSDVEKSPRVPGGNINRLRISDLLAQQLPDGSLRLLVAHHFWKVDEACVVLRVSILEGPQTDLLGPVEKLQWRTLFETTPCLALNVGGHRGLRFASIRGGGAMALLDENALLLTVGDHEFDGWNRTPTLPQETDNSYGKVMLIHIDSGDAEIYSLGHRNSQGLYVDSVGSIWSTDHGPRGGDELNRIERDANYGWPLVTYGTDYRLHNWPLSSRPGVHEGFAKPVFAFVPSIAVTALTGISSDLFDLWRGDLLLVSLHGQLRRIRMDEGRVVVAEPFAIGDRIRDVVQGSDGRIVLWTDLNELIFLEPNDASSGESLAFQCTGCHTLNVWERASIGPNLWNVVGREVGADRNFEYSEAMLNFGGSWTRERLDQFLANPRGVIPGTTMQFEGIPDASQREQLIEFLDRSLQD